LCKAKITSGVGAVESAHKAPGSYASVHVCQVAKKTPPTGCVGQVCDPVME
jgi:hypothetical protein